MATQRPTQPPTSAGDLRERVEIVQQAYRDVLKTFRTERLTYIVLCISSLGAMFYAAFHLFVLGTGDKGLFGIVFGSSGAASAAAVLTIRMLERAVRFIETVISSELKVDSPRGRQR